MRGLVLTILATKAINLSPSHKSHIPQNSLASIIQLIHCVADRHSVHSRSTARGKRRVFDLQSDRNRRRSLEVGDGEGDVWVRGVGRGRHSCGLVRRCRWCLCSHIWRVLGRAMYFAILKGVSVVRYRYKRRIGLPLEVTMRKLKTGQDSGLSKGNMCKALWNRIAARSKTELDRGRCILKTEKQSDQPRNDWETGIFIK